MAADAILTVDALSLLRTAKVWQTARIFRLVMLCKRNGRSPEQICFNAEVDTTLPHLPFEVMTSLLSHVKAAALEALSHEWPYSDNCRCSAYKDWDDHEHWIRNDDFVQWLLSERFTSPSHIAILSPEFIPAVDGGFGSAKPRSCKFNTSLSFDRYDVHTWLCDTLEGRKCLQNMRGRNAMPGESAKELCNNGCSLARVAIFGQIDCLADDYRRPVSSKLAVLSHKVCTTNVVTGGSIQRHEPRTFARDHPTLRLRLQFDGCADTEVPVDPNRCGSSASYSQGAKYFYTLITTPARICYWLRFFAAMDSKHDQNAF